MDIKKAKQFVYIPVNRDNIFISNNLQKLLEMSKSSEYFCSTCGVKTVYALIDTDRGETLMHLSKQSEKYVISERYLLWKYIPKIYSNRKIVNL